MRAARDESSHSRLCIALSPEDSNLLSVQGAEPGKPADTLLHTHVCIQGQI